MKPMIGMIVLLKLNEDMAYKINWSRVASSPVHDCIGTDVSAGMEFPMIVTRIPSEELINGQVILDGNDVFWATFITEGNEIGQWHWPKED